MYAIVDIETTGGYASGSQITEISIISWDGKEVVDRFDSFVNPEERIPPYIQALTGITDEMVADAPTFSQLAELVFQQLQGKVFVAHNVNFDFSFLKYHLGLAGLELQVSKLCTVRMSRKIFPGLPSYSLGKLCRHFSIPLIQRHRAGGDADATVLLLAHLMAHDTKKWIEGSLRRSSGEQSLPINVPKEQVDQLPRTPGVYYFHDSKDKIIYVGKAIEIRKRVLSHFTNNHPGQRKQEFLRKICRISFQQCPTELMSFILESAEIHRLWPVFNRSQKKFEQVYGLFCYSDQNGYLRLCMEKNRRHMHPLHTFHLTSEGSLRLKSLVEEFQLCPVLCFLQNQSVPCSGRERGTCYGACEKAEPPELYNQRVKAALECLKEDLPSFAIVDKGRNAAERSWILMDQGVFYGMGYLPAGEEPSHPGSLKPLISVFADNGFIRQAIYRYAELHPIKVRQFSEAIQA